MVASPQSPAMADNREVSPVHREFARRENAIDKVVISDSLRAADTDPWRDTTEIVGRGSAHEAIAELRRGMGGDILVFGSHVTWNDLLAGLVDELHLIVSATVLGGRTPIFVAPPPAGLRLVGMQTWDDSDNVLVRYSVGGQ